MLLSRVEIQDNENPCMGASVVNKYAISNVAFLWL